MLPQGEAWASGLLQELGYALGVAGAREVAVQLASASAQAPRGEKAGKKTLSRGAWPERARAVPGHEAPVWGTGTLKKSCKN